MSKLFTTFKTRINEDTILNLIFLLIIKIYSHFLGLLFSLRIASCGANARNLGLSLIEGGRKIEIGSNFTAGHHLRLQAICRHSGKNYTPKLHIGNNVNFNDFVHIACAQEIYIGDNCLIASKVIITDHNHEFLPFKVAPILRGLICNPVIIKNNVWIGENVVILPGVTVGESAVIGANSVVNSDVPAFAIAVGAPARVIAKNAN
jgi:lipopolysaccharide O-acetyltransferase